MSHDHGLANVRRLAWALGITALVLVAEVVGAAVTGSLALLVDAAHMLTDTAGLAIALVASRLALRPATARFTWGFKRAEVLAALVQAGVLLAVGLYVLVEGIVRFTDPRTLAPTGLVVFGGFGLIGNVLSLLILRGGKDANLNMRAAFLEVVNDALGSVAVLAAALVIALTGWMQADAVAAIVISLLIIPRTLILLRDSGAILLETVPRGLDLHDVQAHLRALPGVQAVHDVHVSQISTGLPVLTAHVVVDAEAFASGRAQTLLADLQECVAEHFPVNIEHSTFQIESADHSIRERHSGH